MVIIIADTSQSHSSPGGFCLHCSPKYLPKRFFSDGMYSLPDTVIGLWLHPAPALVIYMLATMHRFTVNSVCYR